MLGIWLGFKMNIKSLGSVVGLCLALGFVMPGSASADIIYDYTLIDGTYSSGIITGTLTVDGTTKTVTNVDLTTTRTYDYHFNIIAQQFPNSGFWIVSTKDIPNDAYLELAKEFFRPIALSCGVRLEIPLAARSRCPQRRSLQSPSPPRGPC
jgi:hypothetical protein